MYTLNNELENLLTNVVNQAQQGGKVMLDSVPVDPNMLNQFQSTMPQVKEQMKAAGKDPVLLVPPQLRPLLARYARLFAPGLHVLSYNEVPDELELKIMGALISIQHWCTTAGCGVNALSVLPFRHKFVGMIRRASVASGICA